MFQTMGRGKGVWENTCVALRLRPGFRIPFLLALGGLNHGSYLATKDAGKCQVSNLHALPQLYRRKKEQVLRIMFPV